MSVLAQLETLEAASRRGSPRRTLQHRSSLSISDHDVVIHDISSTGMLIEGTGRLGLHEEIEIELPEIGATQATVVWNSGSYFGCQFSRPISKAAISAVLLRSSFAAPAIEKQLTASLEDADERETEAEAGTDELSFAVKMRVIFGASIALWGLILWSILVT